MQSAQIGSAGPEISLTAVESQRSITPEQCAGHPCLFLFHTHLTLGAVPKVQEAVRRIYQTHDSPLLASVANLGGVPRLLRSVARSAMAKGYRQAENSLPAGASAADYVIILPDWDGRVTEAFGLMEVGHYPALVLLDENWIVSDFYQGTESADAAIRMLRSFGLPPVTLYAD